MTNAGLFHLEALSFLPVVFMDIRDTLARDSQACWRRPVLEALTLTIPLHYFMQTSKKALMQRPLAWRSVCCLCSCTFIIERQIDFLMFL